MKPVTTLVVFKKPDGDQSYWYDPPAAAVPNMGDEVALNGYFQVTRVMKFFTELVDRIEYHIVCTLKNKD